MPQPTLFARVHWVTVAVLASCDAKQIVPTGRPLRSDHETIICRIPRGPFSADITLLAINVMIWEEKPGIPSV
jgi:hypothetical protein